MKLIRQFFTELDRRWKPLGAEPFRLQIIGSAALMLQCDYDRGTKDGDILESKDLRLEVKSQLLFLAEKGSTLHKELRIYVDIVKSAILFLPQRPDFHPVTDLRLKNFTIEALAPVDVAVSKLKRFSESDRNDIRAMADRGLLDQKRFLARFEAAINMFSTDARAEEFPLYIKNLHFVEREILGAEPSVVELPDWMQG